MDGNKLLDELEKYMIKDDNKNNNNKIFQIDITNRSNNNSLFLSKKNIPSLFKKIVNNHNIISKNPKTDLNNNYSKKIVVENTDNNKNTVNKNKYNDELFWMFYIMDKGDEKYEMLGDINVVKEKKEKINYVDVLRNNKSLLKKKKITKLDEIENQLVNENKINIKTFISLCVARNMNLFYICDYKRIFHECITNEVDDCVYFIHKNKYNNSYYQEKINDDFDNLKVKERVEYYRQNYLKMDNIEWKIKSISAFKVCDLKNIINILGIKIENDGKGLTKKDLYESVAQHLRM